MIKPKVYVLTAVHNGLKDTKNLLRSLSNQDYGKVEVYLVDDGSTDGTSRYITEKYPKTKVLKGGGNLWWTGSLCLGVDRIVGIAGIRDFILIVNADCVFDADYINKLVTAGIRNKNSIIGSLIINRKNNQIWDSGVFIDWQKGKFSGRPEIAKRNIRQGKQLASGFDTLPTKGTLFPIKVFKEIGNFDRQNLPHYLSDYEYVIRAERNGYKLLVNYQAKIYNDTKKTGFGETIPKKFSVRYLFSLLFSRRSRVNIIDHWNFVRLACPKKYKLENYSLVILKSLYYLLHVPPLTVFLPLAGKLKS